MSFYIVLAGGVRLERASEAGGATADRGAGRRPTSSAQMDLIDDLPRSATVAARRPTECALLAKWDFQRELRRSPQLSLALGAILHRRLCALESRLVGGAPPDEHGLVA